MKLQVLFLLANMILVNIGILVSFLLRTGGNIPKETLSAYKNSLVFLTLIYILSLSFFRVYKKRFKSSWDLFTRIFLGLFCGTLLVIAFIYVFRIKWGAFPTSVFILSFFINLFLIFKLNQIILKSKGKIKKKVVVIGEGKTDDIIAKKADVERRGIDELIKYMDVDEIVITEEIEDEKILNFLLYIVQRSKVDIVFNPSIYVRLLPDRINGKNHVDFLNTFVGKKPDVDEFFLRTLDIVGSLLVLFIATPVIILVSLLIKITSPGPILYKQKRVGKNGKTFTLYKFRTMRKDAEKVSGFSPATKRDSRVTKVGKWLRITRLDELPQLLNVLKAEMSLVGPRPENLYRVETHKALQGIRLAVKPGLTGLAQIRSFYDIEPQHKIKYDYLYIQRRSVLLNFYILLKTIPVVFSKRGW